MAVFRAAVKHRRKNNKCFKVQRAKKTQHSKLSPCVLHHVGAWEDDFAEGFIVIHASGFLELYVFYLFGRSVKKKWFSFFFPFDVKSQVLWRCIDLNFITAVEPACILNVIQKILCWKCWYYMIPFIESGFISSLMTLFYSLRIWQVICNNQTHVYILMYLRLCIGVKGVDCSNSTVLRSCLNNNNNKWQWCDKGDISVWCLQLSDHCTHFLLIRYLVLYSQKSHICDFSSESHVNSCVKSNKMPA